MNKLGASIFMLFISGISIAGEPSCDITDYGIVGSIPKSQSRISSEQVSTGTLIKSVGEISFQEKTTDIPLKLGIDFGVKHIFSNIPEGGVIIATIKHPPMQTNSGKYKDFSTWQKSPKSNGTSYKLESDNELLPGKWEISFSYKGSVLCSKEFNLSEKK